MNKQKQTAFRGQTDRDPEARKDSSEDEHEDKQQTQGTTDTFITGDKSNLASLTWINTHIQPPHRTAEISERTARRTNQGKKTMGAESNLAQTHIFNVSKHRLKREAQPVPFLIIIASLFLRRRTWLPSRRCYSLCIFWKLTSTATRKTGGWIPYRHRPLVLAEGSVLTHNTCFYSLFMKCLGRRKWVSFVCFKIRVIVKPNPAQQIPFIRPLAILNPRIKLFPSIRFRTLTVFLHIQIY